MPWTEGTITTVARELDEPGRVHRAAYNAKQHGRGPDGIMMRGRRG